MAGFGWFKLMYGIFLAAQGIAEQINPFIQITIPVLYHPLKFGPHASSKT